MEKKQNRIRLSLYINKNCRNIAKLVKCSWHTHEPTEYILYIYLAHNFTKVSYTLSALCLYTYIYIYRSVLVFSIFLFNIFGFFFFFNYKGLRAQAFRSNSLRNVLVYTTICIYYIYIKYTAIILSRARGIELKPSKSSRTVYNLFLNTQRRIHSAVFFIHIHAGAEETGEGLHTLPRPGHMARTTPGGIDSRDCNRNDDGSYTLLYDYYIIVSSSTRTNYWKFHLVYKCCACRCEWRELHETDLVL